MGQPTLVHTRPRKATKGHAWGRGHDAAQVVSWRDANAQAISWRDANAQAISWRDANAQVVSWRDANAQVVSWRDANAQVISWRDANHKYDQCPGTSRQRIYDNTWKPPWRKGGPLHCCWEWKSLKSHYGEWYAGPHKTKNRASLRSCNPAPGPISE